MEKEKLREAIEKKILAHKEQEKKLDVLNTNFEAYAVKNVEAIVEKCNYRIGNLENAHMYAGVADNEEIQRNVDDLTSSITSLEGEVADLSTIKKNVSVLLNVPDFDDLAGSLVSNIDKIISTSEKTIKKGKLIIDNKYDEARDIDSEVKVTNVSAPAVEEKKEIVADTPVENKSTIDNAFTPTAVRTDSLEELARSLDASISPLQTNEVVNTPQTFVQPFNGSIIQNNDMLNNQNNMVATNSTVAPVLNPIQQQPLGVAPQVVQTPVSPVAPVAPVEAIQSAKSVDDGFVKVDSVIEFTQNNTQTNQEEGPALKRVA